MFFHVYTALMFFLHTIAIFPPKSVHSRTVYLHSRMSQVHFEKKCLRIVYRYIFLYCKYKRLKHDLDL